MMIAMMLPGAPPTLASGLFALGYLLVWAGFSAVAVGLQWALEETGLLMALLFLAGVMNLTWIAGLVLIVLLDKAVPQGLWINRAVGLGLVGWALWRLVG